MSVQTSFEYELDRAVEKGGKTFEKPPDNLLVGGFVYKLKKSPETTSCGGASKEPVRKKDAKKKSEKEEAVAKDSAEVSEKEKPEHRFIKIGERVFFHQIATRNSRTSTDEEAATKLSIRYHGWAYQFILEKKATENLKEGESIHTVDLSSDRDTL